MTRHGCAPTSTMSLQSPTSSSLPTNRARWRRCSGWPVPRSVAVGMIAESFARGGSGAGGIYERGRWHSWTNGPGRATALRAVSSSCAKRFEIPQPLSAAETPRVLSRQAPLAQRWHVRGLTIAGLCAIAATISAAQVGRAAELLSIHAPFQPVCAAFQPVCAAFRPSGAAFQPSGAAFQPSGAAFMGMNAMSFQVRIQFCQVVVDLLGPRVQRRLAVRARFQ